VAKKIKIKRIVDTAGVVVGTAGEWVDIITAEIIEFKKGEPKLIKLGIAVKLPKNYEAIVAERSSTFGRYGLLLTNSIGVIDNAYCGNDDEWGAMFYPTRDVTVTTGTRLLQFRIQKCQPEIKVEYVDDLKGTNRGGFGSTGR
jgi:dUTP pyrophosphatase